MSENEQKQLTEEEKKDCGCGCIEANEQEAQKSKPAVEQSET